MFLELHLFENLFEDDEKILLNINKIQCIGQSKGITYIDVGDSIYRVKESYEDVIKAINNWNRLANA